MALLRRLLTGLRLARGTNAFEARALLGFGGQRWYWEADRDAPGNKGEKQAKPDEELYGRPDRDLVPSPAESLTQEAASSAGMTPKPEPVSEPKAYPLKNDPSVGGGMAPKEDEPLPQDESSGPKAAGQDAINAGEFAPKGTDKNQAGSVWSDKRGGN